MPSEAVNERSPHPLRVRGSETSRLIAAFDWTSTGLGAIDAWPLTMRSTIALILRSPVPIVTLWGADGIMIYNDAYAAFAGGRHPGLLGMPVREGWPEVADFNDHVMKVGLGGGTLACTDQELTLRRNGQPEQVWMDLDCSPLVDDQGAPVGVIAIVVETTERVLAARRQEGEQEPLRRMFDQAPGFMAMVAGPAHRFQLANPGCVNLVGQQALLGKTVLEAMPDLAAQGGLAQLDEVFRSGHALAAQRVRFLRQATHGERVDPRFVDFVFQPVLGQTGEVLGIFIQGADVTDRVTAEQALGSSELRNRQILDSAIDFAIVATDLEGRVTRWNEGARHLLGWTEHEMVGQGLERIFVDDDRIAGLIAEERRAALQHGRTQSDGWRVRRSGERFWGNGAMTPLRDESGRATGFVKVLRDRTEEHEQALALVKGGEQLRRAQEAGGVGVFSIELATNTIYTTPEFCRIFGLADRREIPAPEVERLILESDSHLVSNAARRAAGTAQLDVEYRIRRPDSGEERVIARRGEYERDAQGRPMRMVGVVQDVTERRHVQRALEQSERQFRALAQAIPNQAWTAQPDGVLDWFNEQVYAYSGLTESQLRGSGWTVMVHRADREATAQRWAASLASGETYEAEFRLQRFDGEFRWHLARALPIRAEDGRIVQWVGTNTDIHVQKQAETATARDRDRMWAMSQDLMLICDVEGRITAVNPSATRMLGWPEAEMIGHAISEFIHPDDLARSAREVNRLAHGTTTLSFENRYRTKDGRYRLLDWTAVPDADRIHGVGRDITDERTSMRDQERIWKLSPVVKVVVGKDGRISRANPAWTQVLGWAAEDAEGRALVDFVATEEREAASRAFGQGGAAMSSAEQQFAFTSQDGSKRLIVWRLVRESGVLYGFGRDVTEQRAAEEALRQSQKMEAVGQLTGGIAHDFNNLLQGITGSLEVVQKRVAQGRVDDLDRFVRGAVGSAKRAAALTHRLLAFSRRQPLDPKPVRANPLIASMEDMLRRTLGERVRLELVLADDLWTTRCDPNQLESAILNLAINARDAMPEGGRLIIETGNAHLDSHYARRHRDVKPGQYVCISVTDTGIGMSKDTISKAFEPFFTTKPIGQGTGLGLSMIYGFASQSEGSAKIYSELGTGTTFKLYLPRHRGDDVAEDAPEAVPAQPALHGETVLVVEDEDVVRSLIVEVLRDLGYHALEAADGPEGLGVLQSDRRIDLLITDIGLPGLNGRQIAEAARLLRKDLKVLFMTGYAESAALASGFLEPGMAMITKPFAMDVLASRIRELIGR